MKKILMLMTILSFALKVAWAENTDVSRISNTIYIENFSVKVGEEKTVSVKMKNNIAPTGFQFDIVLPEGISIKTEDDFYCIDLSTARTTSRKTDTFSSARRSDGSIRVICSSTNNYTFSGNDGEVASIVFKVNANATPGDFTLTLKNVELSEANGTAHPVGVDVKSTITVTADTENEKNIIASGECGENATWTLDDEGLLTISGTGAMTNYGTAPWYDYRSSIKNVQIENGITTVGSHAFGYCSSLTDITIPSSVTSIEGRAFDGCSGLTNITIPNSVTNIGNYAFDGCSGLTDITIPNSVTSIGSNAFDGCSGLTNITIPNSVTSIGSNAFRYCSVLTSIVVEDGNKVYDSRDNCNAIIETSTNTLIAGCQNTVIPNSVTSIGSYAFYGCSNLANITIPNSVTSIEGSAFNGCNSLTNITIPNSVASIGSNAFRYCSVLTSIVVEDGNKVYDSRDNCNGIIEKSTNTLIAGCQNTVIPNSVTSIGSYAFSGCSGLTNITIPGSVTSIGKSAFSGCFNLASVTNYSTTPQEIASYTFSNDGTLHVVKGAGEAYANADYWKNFTIVEDATYANIIASGECGANATWTLDNEGLLTISGTGAMTDYKSYTNVPWYSYYDSIKKVQIEDGITTIGNSAFRFCSGLANATISSSVTSIGESAFWGCSGLNDITIPSSVTNIGDYAFDDCSGLTNMTIPNSVTNIGVCAFRGCSGLANITISSSVQSISSEVFCGCTGLTSITIPSGVTRIESDAFKDCTGLTSITIPGSMTSIGYGAFMYCSVLTSITIPNSVTNIGEKAFYGCSGLTSITIPNSVTSIGSHAFIGCSGLTSIIVDNDNKVYDSRDNCNAIIRTSTNLLVFGCQNTVIPNSVTCIGSSAFTRCSGLASITIPNSVTSIDYYAFLACSGLSSITIPNSVTNIESSAFNECDNLISVTNYSATPQEITSSTFSNYGTLHVVKGAGEAYANADYWKNFTIVEDAVGTEVYENTDISQMTDVLYSAEMKAKSGKQIVLPIYMKNSEAVTLFQTNVYLPQGFTFAKKANGKYAVSLMKDRLTDEDDNHVISSNVQPDGSLLILCSSQDNYTFDGNDGLVATVTIDVADDVAEGPYLIKLNNQKMVRPDNTGSNVAEYQVVLTVKNYTLGDVNDDGDIDGYDLVGISNLILGTNTDGLIRDAADVNSDGDVDGYDYVMEVNTILGTASAAKGKNTTLTENALSALTIPTMNVTAGERTQLAVGMECNGDVFTLVQTDIEFPEGVEPMLRNGRVVAKLAGECLGGADDHSISCVKQGNGKYRILIASQDNTGFTGKDGQLFTIGIETSKDMLPGMYDITLSNTKLVRVNNTGVNPSDLTAMMVCNEATGINCVEGDNADEQMYNLNGQRVSKHAQRGVYISNGKKNVKQ